MTNIVSILPTPNLIANPIRNFNFTLQDSVPDDCDTLRQKISELQTEINALYKGLGSSTDAEANLAYTKKVLEQYGLMLRLAKCNQNPPGGTPVIGPQVAPKESPAPVGNIQKQVITPPAYSPHAGSNTAWKVVGVIGVGALIVGILILTDGAAGPAVPVILKALPAIP
jgi:hypothetical protein